MCRLFISFAVIRFQSHDQKNKIDKFINEIDKQLNEYEAISHIKMITYNGLMKKYKAARFLIPIILYTSFYAASQPLTWRQTVCLNGVCIFVCALIHLSDPPFILCVELVMVLDLVSSGFKPVFRIPGPAYSEP